MISTLSSAAGTAFERTAGTVRALGALTRSGVVRPIRPDRLVGLAGGVLRYGLSMAGGYTVGAARHPRRTAIVDDAGALSYAEVRWRTDRLARALADAGVGAGTAVGVLCRNHRGPIEVMVAAGKLGADVVLLNTGLSAGQLGGVADELGLHTVVADAEFSGSGVLAELPTGCNVITAWGPAPEGGTTLEELIAREGRSGLPVRPAPGRTIVLTSGTTGTPKGARRPHPSSLAPAASILSEIPLRAGETVFIAAPLFHTWGNAGLLLAVLHGSTVVLRRRFTPQALLDTVAEHRCEVVFAVPVMLQRVLESDADGWRGAHPRVVAVSGSALPGDLAVAFMDRFGDVLYNLYGSTEVSWVSIAGPADLRDAPGTAGRAPAGTRLLILDDDGRPVPSGTEGRVFVGNDLPFEGYTRAGVEIEEHDGLLGTGDIGRLDERGRLHLTGRADDMIVSGGENVHPGPVEDLIAQHGQVREVAVIGVPDEQFGQRLAAYLVVTPGASLDADAVRELVRGRLARFAVPRDVVFVDELPRNSTGKIVARELPQPR
ncbi:AMP-binding protein [Pseudonocardia sp. H11422]|uniref:AMP-binding protein n=1 Tax=Pseudonocardia sp. H11422 TaxID=2835866 RepID=UPI0027E30018|nr:AMP-binding protein [Pseudonocardia sp. H11422]